MSTAAPPPSTPEDGREQPLPVGASARRPAAGAPPPPRRSGGTQALALFLALLAILGTGYLGWRQWQLAQGSAASEASVARLQQRMATLESALRAADSKLDGVPQQLDRMAQQTQDVSAQVPALDQRTRHLEDAVATLAERTQSGREPMLLDETESLLRMAAERYRLFNDASGAERAYGLADETLAAVDDGAFSAVRQTIHSERDALARTHPGNRDAALQQLQDLRGRMQTLPLKPQNDATEGTGDGVWARIGRALAGIIRVQRDNGGPMALQDARLARELALLDLAQAQTALLAYDGKAYIAALQRADTSLTTQFDRTAPPVQQAHVLLQQLEAMAPSGARVQLGQALIELRNLRAVHALAPASASTSAQGVVPPVAPSPARAYGVPAAGSRS